ncbi:putative ensconsin-like [Cocos nucifera]|nr:putative ensconsin-like [Cocos nucifera]
MPEVVDQMADLNPWHLIWGSLETILKSGYQMLAYIKRMHRQEAEAQKAQKDLQAEIHHLQESVAEVEHLTNKMVGIESF